MACGFWPHAGGWTGHRVCFSLSWYPRSWSFVASSSPARSPSLSARRSLQIFIARRDEPEKCMFAAHVPLLWLAPGDLVIRISQNLKGENCMSCMSHFPEVACACLQAVQEGLPRPLTCYSVGQSQIQSETVPAAGHSPLHWALAGSPHKRPTQIVRTVLQWRKAEGLATGKVSD